MAAAQAWMTRDAESVRVMGDSLTGVRPFVTSARSSADPVRRSGPHNRQLLPSWQLLDEKRSNSLHW
jgi:hypothetical protein